MDLQEVSEVAPEVHPPEHTTMTVEEFLARDIEGYEYAKGELVPMSSPSLGHGKISARITHYLFTYVSENQLGDVYVEAGFKVGERGMKPDIAFISTDHLPEDESKGAPIPPDFAVEVISPTDVQWRVTEKVQAYLEAGTQMVWVVESVMETVTVYRSETDIKVFTSTDTLTGEDVVPGFSCPVAQLFK
ncbi:Uma2 family endonuclease [Candidatus Poribacteria bacterium]|nr:Uma2 family endonuclease [Candidatus Poribacteria bacterium]MYH79928.1 Uma2 family endonuclease [Candidatus Poribacteria bacterium]